MFRKQKPEVLVVGGGPVGQFAALRLARRGIPTQIIDHEWQPTPHSYALALHPASIELLQREGLGADLLRESVRVDRVAFFEGGRREAEVELGLLDAGSPFVAVLRQDRLEHLLEHALKDAGLKVQWSHRLARFQQDADRVVATVDKLSKESLGYVVPHTDWSVQKSSDVPVRFVIGTDGHASLVRQQLKIAFPEIAAPQQFAVFEFETDALLGNEVRVILDETTSGVMWPLPGNSCRFSFEIPDVELPTSSRAKDRTDVVLDHADYPVLEPEMMHTLLRERAPWFEGDVRELRWRVAVRFERRLADAFGKHRMWLAGDAGHTTSPVGVQSMNVGLREAADLTEIIAAIIHDRASLSDLEHYGAGRIAEWNDLLGRGNRFEPGPDASAWIQSRAARIAPCLPASGRDLAQLAKQLGLTARAA